MLLYTLRVGIRGGIIVEPFKVFGMSIYPMKPPYPWLIGTDEGWMEVASLYKLDKEWGAMYRKLTKEGAD
jgi:hypothetical protein